MAPFSMRYFVRNVMSVTVIGGISVSGFPLTFSTGGGGGGATGFRRRANVLSGGQNHPLSQTMCPVPADT